MLNRPLENEEKTKKYAISRGVQRLRQAYQKKMRKNNIITIKINFINSNIIN